MQTLTIIGLALDGVGAIFIGVTELWRPAAISREETIDRLETGRSTFFEQAELSDGDPGFQEVAEAVEPRVETHGPVIELARVHKLDGQGDRVEVRYDTDGDSAYGYSEIGPELIERWVEQRVGELRRQARARALAIGGGLLFVGFTAQFFAVLP